MVSGLILVSTWSLLRKSLNLALDAVPHDLELDEVRAYLARLPRVSEIHDLHVWGISATETALTAHVVLLEGTELEPCFLPDVAKAMHQTFGIGHTTVQIRLRVSDTVCARP